jgi:hypothetical protein
MRQSKLFDEPCPKRHLDDARQEVRIGLKEGVECPCCGQLARLYRRKLNSQMARFLCRLFAATIDNPRAEWFHVRDFLEETGHKASSDGSYLAHWKLVEPKPLRPGSPSSGFWRITQAGMEFARGNITVASHAFIFNGRCDGFASTQISIHKALDNKFDYAELMGRN